MTNVCGANMAHTFQIHCVHSVAARSDGHRAHSWVTLDIASTDGRSEVTLFCKSRDMADAIANAINYANASAAVQTNHDRRLSDAGIQEYRDLIVALPEGV
jgi:hypothetical protein